VKKIRRTRHHFSTAAVPTYDDVQPCKASPKIWIRLPPVMPVIILKSRCKY